MADEKIKNPNITIILANTKQLSNLNNILSNYYIAAASYKDVVLGNTTLNRPHTYYPSSPTVRLLSVRVPHTRNGAGWPTGSGAGY